MPAHINQTGGNVSITEDARTLSVSHQADVVILGGGVAGLAAALAAAETGSRYGRPRSHKRKATSLSSHPISSGLTHRPLGRVQESRSLRAI